MRRVAHIILLLSIGLSFLFTPNVRPEAKPSAPKVSVAGGGYHEIAEYISRRVLALKGKVTGFESISASKHINVWERPFKPVVAYDHGVTRWEPIPDAEPRMNRPVFSNRGCRVVIWMVNGDLTWSPPRSPVKVGGYTVSAELWGPQQARIQRVIDQIVADAADRFSRQAQSNNSLQVSAG